MVIQNIYKRLFGSRVFVCASSLVSFTKDHINELSIMILAKCHKLWLYEIVHSKKKGRVKIGKIYT